MSAQVTLTDETWQSLSEEYLLGLHSDQDRAEESADMLAAHIATEVWGPKLGVHLLGPDGRAWEAVQDSEPYPDLDSMIGHYGTFEAAMQVSDLYHDHPVFTREDNLRFRVWHDTGHIVHRLGFDRHGELALFVLQARQLGDERLVEALFSESVYQLAAAIVLGTFPDEQFVRTPGPTAQALLAQWTAITV